jgi:hypothetical protein
MSPAKEILEHDKGWHVIWRNIAHVTSTLQITYSEPAADERLGAMPLRNSLFDFGDFIFELAIGVTRLAFTRP